MTIKEAIVSTIGKDKYNGMVEAGASDISILENACLTAFLNPAGDPDAILSLRTTLSLVWDKPPGSFHLQLDVAQ